jgi:hypothetical protein
MSSINAAKSEFICTFTSNCDLYFKGEVHPVVDREERMPVLVEQVMAFHVKLRENFDDADTKAQEIEGKLDGFKNEIT